MTEKKKMPQTLNTRELVAAWLTHVKQNNIANPTDDDLTKFLTGKGYDADIVKNLVDALPDSGKKTPAQVELTAAQQAGLKNIKKTLNGYTKKQILQLKQELSNG